tara:strand:+ start:3143 stop:4000 length:858 start_codon:yes stop_codon:yes gene_type:complete
VKQIVATDDGLLLARQIAEKLDIPFDEEETRSNTRYLLDHYYQDIHRVLEKETDKFVFHNLAMKQIEAFSDYTKNGTPVVFVDQFFGPYFFGLNALLCFVAFYPHDFESLKEISDIFRDSLETFSDPTKDVVVRERLKPLLIKYVDALPVANALAYSSIAHIICHEIAHHNLGHLQQPPKRHQELSADKLGYQYFLKLIEHQELMSHLKIGENMACAPIVSLDIFALMEDRGHLTIDNNTHPSASSRAADLGAIFDRKSNEEAKNLYTGLRLSLEELHNMLTDQL